MDYNKIYNADAYEFIKTIPDKSIDCIYTDVPYLYNNGDGGSSALAQRVINRETELRTTELEKGINYKILDDFVRVMKKINCFIWCSKLQIIDILNYFNQFPDCNFEILTWCKTNPTPTTNNTWLPDIEYCLYFREKGVKLNSGYENKSKWFISGINKADKDLFDHPTIKPLNLVMRHLKHATQENDIILDPFMGSGTTCVACKELNRNYIGVEIVEHYYEIAKDRLNNITQREKESEVIKQCSLFDF